MIQKLETLLQEKTEEFNNIQDTLEHAYEVNVLEEELNYLVPKAKRDKVSSTLAFQYTVPLGDEVLTICNTRLYKEDKPEKPLSIFVGNSDISIPVTIKELLDILDYNDFLGGM